MPRTPGLYRPGLGARAPLIGCAAVAWRGLGEELLATNGGSEGT